MQWLFSKRVLLGFSLAAVLVVFLYDAGDARRRSSIELALTVIGGGGALYGLLLNVFTMRTVSAARFIERWNDPQLARMRETMRRLASASGLPEGEVRSDLDAARAEVANFFEELAILVLHKGSDNHLLKDFFRSPLCDCYLNLKPWIAEMRHAKQQPTACQHFEKLYEQWSTTTPKRA